MQATQTHSVVRQGSQVAIMSHLKPFSPAMACERQPLSKLPLEARAMIEAYCGPPMPTPTAAIIKQVGSVQLGDDMDVLSGRGFEKYLFNHFKASPGAVWTHRFTHRRLGHTLFFNFFPIHPSGVWIYGGGVDRNGDSIEYPGLEKFLIN